MEKERLRCKQCGSGQIYYRQTTDEIVCKTCGNINKLEETK